MMSYGRGKVGPALPGRDRHAGWEHTRDKPTVDGMTTIPSGWTATDRTLSGGPQRVAPYAAPQRPPLVELARRVGIDSQYILLGFPIAVASFVVLTTGLSTGAGMLVTLVGFPILTASLYAARGFAELERLRIAPVLRLPYTRGAYRHNRDRSTIWRRVIGPLFDGQYWLDVAHGFVIFPLSTITWSIAVTWWSGGLGGILYWSYDWALPHDASNVELPDILGMGNTAVSRIAIYTAVGVFFLGTLPFVMRGCAVAQAYVGQLMLNGLGGMRERITGLEHDTVAARAQTAAAVSAEATALRRLERDIHDGPQQRLVRLALDLGRAQHQLDTNPDAARQTVAEALTQTRETLDELRALSRGIAPPILADRGLAAAIAALSGRATVPVDLDVDVSGRLSDAVENTAYFVVAEALTNVAKHSYASECRISLAREGMRLRVSVTDDGLGGAHLAKGHGLAGLADRVQAAGGALVVQSPPGGPTTVLADLPCP
jgi:signal transduction histidine kinase